MNTIEIFERHFDRLATDTQLNKLYLLMSDTRLSRLTPEESAETKKAIGIKYDGLSHYKAWRRNNFVPTTQKTSKLGIIDKLIIAATANLFIPIKKD